MRRKFPKLSDSKVLDLGNLSIQKHREIGLKKLDNIKYLTSVAIVVGVLFSCKPNEMEKVLEFSNYDSPPVRSTRDVLYTFTDSAKITNTLKAAKIDQYQSPDSSYSKISGGFVLTFFDSHGAFDGQLTAKNGFIKGDQSQMIARDSVVFQNKENETLHTEELIWYQDSAKVYTDKFVTIERKDAIIYGKGLVSNQNFTNYIITEPTGIINISDDKE